MYRACSTWQYEVVAHLLESHRGGRRLGYLMPEEYRELRRATDSTPHGDAGCVVFKSHDADPCFARAIAEGRATAIYAYRDVRDVVFSLVHKRSLTFEQLLRQGMIHQVLANDRFWTRQPQVLIQRYDAILADPVNAVNELAHHLGIEPAEGEAERIADEYSLASNRARTEALRRQLERDGLDLQDAANALICDSTTLLHWNHVRDGSSGSWYAESTARQRAILTHLCGKWLAAHGYPELPEGAESDVEPWSVAERTRMTGDILAGWLSFHIRAVSQRYPRTVALVKRCLGQRPGSRAGAVVWPEKRA